MTSVNKFKKCIEMYDSKDSLDTTAAITYNYNKIRQRIKEINKKN